MNKTVLMMLLFLVGAYAMGNTAAVKDKALLALRESEGYDSQNLAVVNDSNDFDEVAFQLLDPPLPETWCLVYNVAEGLQKKYVTLFRTRDESYCDTICVRLNSNNCKVDPASFSKYEIKGINSDILNRELIHIFDTGVDEAKPLLILMPSDSQEYMDCMRCVDDFRIICGNKMRVRISSAAVIGAFWIEGNKYIGNEDVIKNSFVYHKSSSPYPQYCEMETQEFNDDKGSVSEVMSLRKPTGEASNSIELSSRDISLGCLLLHLILQGDVRDALLLNVIPYKIFIGVRKKGTVQIERFLEFPYYSDEGVNVIPNRRISENIGDLSGKELVLYVGYTESVVDLLTKLEIGDNLPKDLSIGWETDADMMLFLLVYGEGINKRMSLGELSNQNK